METTNSKYPRIMEIAGGQPWAIAEGRLEPIAQLLALRMNGLKYSQDEVEQKITSSVSAASSKSAGGEVANVAVISISGILAPKMDMMTEMSGGTSTERLGQEFDAAINDISVKAVVFDIDSNGGSVYGLNELSDKIYAARGAKPIIAVANPVAFSAAYFIASAADEVVVTASGEVGSIGCVCVHFECSEADKTAGDNYTIVRSSVTKYEGNSYEPLTEGAKGRIQADVDFYAGEFVRHVARNRGVTPQNVLDNYGQGKCFTAPKALAAGLVDRIATRDEVIQGLIADIQNKSLQNAKRNQNESRIRELTT